MPTPQMIHFVLNTETNEVQMFATRFLPVTNNTGCRLKWWRINVSLEQIDTATTRQWSYSATGQRDELQHQLGPGFRVLQQFEALKAIETAYTAESLKKFHRDQKVRDIRTGCTCTVVFITAETGKIMVNSPENATRTNSDGYNCPSTYEDNASFFEPIK